LADRHSGVGNELSEEERASLELGVADVLLFGGGGLVLWVLVVDKCPRCGSDR
jgi:hypothetical protein